MTAPPSLLGSYRPRPHSFDELWAGPGAGEAPAPGSSLQLRPGWAALAAALDGLGIAELRRRADDAARMLVADGVTYRAADATVGGNGPANAGWRLDPVPVVITSDEWATIEGGIIERAELADLVLADLYGPRDLVRRGLLPPEVVYGNPAFLRPCDGVGPPGGRYLISYAVDLGRRADGTMVALADHAEAPSGAGYALENRLVVSRALPSLYREAQVHRLAPYFRALRAALAAAAPPTATDPRIVVLSPGPWSETAFEHAFLASYLGYSLVQAGDLTVRDRRVWLRSVGALQPVDVILRRVDASWCDPLELRGDSRLGVPGLIEATRAGTVSVVNPLGSAAVENPAIMAFLPALAGPLLGRPLRLVQADTWWCGEPAGLRRALAQLDTLAFKPVTGAAGGRSVMGWALTTAERDELRLRLEAEPGAWVAQEAVPLATAPTLADAPTLAERPAGAAAPAPGYLASETAGPGLVARSVLLRAFAVARGDSYTVMAGGLTRAASEDRADGKVSNRTGALSKDTWVLASEPEPATGFWLRAGPVVAATEPAASISARAAESLFWLGRYAERAEQVVRLLRVTYDRRNDFAGGASAEGTACLRALLIALTHVTTTYPGFVGSDDSSNRDSAGNGTNGGPGGAGAASLDRPGPELLSLVVDANRTGTLAHAVGGLLDAASSVRDLLSGDLWLMIGNLEAELRSLGGAHPDHQAVVQGALSRSMPSLLALAGLAAESHVRDPGWCFTDAGRRIERATQLAALLQATVTTARDTATDSLLYESVLTAAESIITYRRRYRSQAQLETVLDLLMSDSGNPRSLRYQLDRLSEDIATLPRAASASGLSAEERLVLESSTALRLADTVRLARTDETGERPELDALLAATLDRLRRLSDAIDAAHFGRPMPQQLL